MRTLVTDLTTGDRFAYCGVTVTVIEPAVPTNDPFGRSGFSRLLASRSDTSGIGTMLFGQGASVEQVSEASS